MKEKLTFIITLVGGFSATIILLINHALTILGCRHYWLCRYYQYSWYGVSCGIISSISSVL